MVDLEVQESNKNQKKEYISDKEISKSKSSEKIFYEIPKFDGKNVPVKEVARLMGKDQQFIRQGIINGKLPIGTAFKKHIIDEYGQIKESSFYDFYVSPKLLYEYTGIIYNENKSDRLT